MKNAPFIKAEAPASLPSRVLTEKEPRCGLIQMTTKTVKTSVQVAKASLEPPLGISPVSAAQLTTAKHSNLQPRCSRTPPNVRTQHVQHPARARAADSRGACSPSRPPQYSPGAFWPLQLPTCPGWDVWRYSSAAAAAAATAAAAGGDGTSPR